MADLPAVPGLFEEDDPDFAEEKPAKPVPKEQCPGDVRAFKPLLEKIQKTPPPGVPMRAGAVTLLLQLTSASLYTRGAFLPPPNLEALKTAVLRLANKLRPHAKNIVDVRRALELHDIETSIHGYDLYRFVHSSLPSSDGGLPAIAALTSDNTSGALQQQIGNCLSRTLLACLVAEELHLEPVVSRSCASPAMKKFCDDGARLAQRGNPGVHHLDNLRKPLAKETVRFSLYNPLESRFRAVEDFVLMPLWATLVDFLRYGGTTSCLATEALAARRLRACFDAVRSAARVGSGNQSLWVRCGGAMSELES
jgi:hypothetical protein